VHVLDAPATLDELDGQPIEQSLVCWWWCLLSEVVGVLDQAVAEVTLPDAIDHHS